MKEEVLESLKSVEEKLKNGHQLENDDVVFLFGLSLLKDQKDGD